MRVVGLLVVIVEGPLGERAGGADGRLAVQALHLLVRYSSKRSKAGITLVIVTTPARENRRVASEKICGMRENEQTKGQEPRADNDRSHPAGLARHYCCAQSRSVIALVVQLEINVFGLFLLIKYTATHICAEIRLNKRYCASITQRHVLSRFQ